MCRLIHHHTKKHRDVLEKAVQRYAFLLKHASKIKKNAIFVLIICMIMEKCLNLHHEKKIVT